MQKIQANDTPDIAFIPQPGVVADVVERGDRSPLDEVLDMDSLEESMVPGTLEAGTVDDKLYGLLVSMNVKSLVMYPKKAWAKEGYKPPTDHRGTEHAHRADEVRRQHPVVHGHRVRHRDGLAGHGLVRGPGDALRRSGGVQEWVKQRDQVRLRRRP